jgi:hypothetical protein
MRGMAGQPRLVPREPRVIQLSLSDSIAISDSVSVEHRSVTWASSYAVHSASARISGGGNVSASGHAMHGRRDVRAEVLQHVTIFTAAGWLGEQAIGTAEGALGSAVVGLFASFVLWERHAHPPDF